ncbi:hypothetical protein F511_33485 [Dorcoceras hygrometricum]|uniref:Uncharacterized protein n=1 Tax=Dorcoceras hygrometricum TaxID=472368 RepID=A0A2Z7CAF9_9LAMI|nr:hypothetical protein F511_33485 [Dorcoceras hygrometricum]
MKSQQWISSFGPGPDGPPPPSLSITPPPPAAAANFAGKRSGLVFEEYSFVPISSALLVQPDEGVSDLVVDRIGVNYRNIPRRAVFLKHRLEPGTSAREVVLALRLNYLATSIGAVCGKTLKKEDKTPPKRIRAPGIEDTSKVEGIFQDRKNRGDPFSNLTTAQIARRVATTVEQLLDTFGGAYPNLSSWVAHLPTYGASTSATLDLEYLTRDRISLEPLFARPRRNLRPRLWLAYGKVKPRLVVILFPKILCFRKNYVVVQVNSICSGKGLTCIYRSIYHLDRFGNMLTLLVVASISTTSEIYYVLPKGLLYPSAREIILCSSRNPHLVGLRKPSPGAVKARAPTS